MTQAFEKEFGEGEGELITLQYCRPLPMRLDRWLVSQRPEQSRSRIQKLINAGYVKVNNIIGKAKTPLRPRDNVVIWLPPPEPLSYLQPEAMDLDILFEDKHIIVINKKAGITVHPAPGNKSGTLVNGLIHHCKDLQGIGGKLRPGIVHRLDKDTTGCIVVAKTQQALVHLQEQIQKRIASRKYIAIVHGNLSASSGSIIGNIGRSEYDRKKYAVVNNDSGRYACTHWEMEERLGNYSLIKFKLDTGRTHQIRVHCSHIGHPILGDITYSKSLKFPIKLSGQLLHAIKLGLIHPITRQSLDFNAPLPKVFSKTLLLLQNRKNNK